MNKLNEEGVQNTHSEEFRDKADCGLLSNSIGEIMNNYVLGQKLQIVNK